MGKNKEELQEPDVSQEVSDLLEGVAPPPSLEPETEESETEEHEEKGEEAGEKEEEDTKEKGKKSEETEEAEETKEGEEEEEKEEKEEEEKKEGKEEEEDNAENLRKLLEKMAGEVQTGEPAAPSPHEKGEEEEEKGGKKGEEEKPPEVPEFVTEAEFGDALISRQALNNLLLKVYDKAIATAREEAVVVKREAVESALLRTPEVVAKLVENKLAMERAVNDFYKQNPHLSNYRQYVGVVATRLRAEHPDWDLVKLTESVAETASKELGLKVGSTIVDKGGRKPAFVETPKGGKPTSENLTGLEKEISEMM